MYIVETSVPHFMSDTIGPVLPRQAGYSSSKGIAYNMAKECQGWVRNINE